MALYVLHESMSSYGSCSTHGIDAIGQNTGAIRSSVVDLNRLGKVVKLSAFSSFESALDALNQCNAISEGQMIDELRNFLDLTLPKGQRGQEAKVQFGSDRANAWITYL